MSPVCNLSQLKDMNVNTGTKLPSGCASLTCCGINEEQFLDVLDTWCARSSCCSGMFIRSAVSEHGTSSLEVFSARCWMSVRE
eukprot:6474623-Amphidinium_carterae.1